MAEGCSKSSAKKIHIWGTPAYRARLRRKRKERNDPSEIVEIGDGNDEELTEISMNNQWEFDLKVLQSFVFDSMRTGDIPLGTKEAIASLFCTAKKSITLVS